MSRTLFNPEPIPEDLLTDWLENCAEFECPGCEVCEPMFESKEIVNAQVLAKISTYEMLMLCDAAYGAAHKIRDFTRSDNPHKITNVVIMYPFFRYRRWDDVATTGKHYASEIKNMFVEDFVNTFQFRFGCLADSYHCSDLSAQVNCVI